ncbi:MAG: M48 family metalloprotease [Deltaproteobacteria bacterium]|jgi:predicted Zn-dependent protease|nr:M48 family metalloprotease [Deltaproteobacteria bacterium]
MAIRWKPSACFAFALAAAFWAATGLQLVRSPAAQALSQQEEIELGREVRAQLAAQQAFFDDPIANAYFQRVCARVLKAAGPLPHPFSFYLINSDSLNAFAIPGGFIFLHTETVSSLENEGQLAAILSHEVAHITSRHFARRSEAARSASMLNLAGLLAGVLLASSGSGGQNTGALGQALLIGTTGATIQAMLANSRADETEADAKGRAYMIKAGYNPRDMFGAFRIMNEKSYQLSGQLPGYLSTHPGLSSRLASTFADQAAAPPAPPDPKYQAVKDRVMALTAQPRRIRDVFGKRLAEDPDDASAHHALGLLAMREMSYAQAEKSFNRAVELQPNRGEYLSDLGELALKRRKPQEAVKSFEAARRGGELGLQTTLGLARAYELTNRKKEAAPLYDEAAAEAGDFSPRALELAGRFFGQNGQLAKGHFLLADYFIASGQAKDAAFHCRTAQQSPGGAGYKTLCEQKLRDAGWPDEDEKSRQGDQKQDDQKDDQTGKKSKEPKKKG